MVMRRQCAFRHPSGEPCKAPPLKDSQFCWFHSPENAEEVQKARRLGGLRRKREATVLAAYDFEGVDTLEGILRLLQLVAIDILSMENGMPRNRTLIYLAMVADSSRANREEVVWKDMSGMLLTKLYAFRQATATISQRYFDGEEVLFTDLVRSLAELIKYTEDLVAMFNDEVVGKPEDKIDLEAFRHDVGKAVMQQTSYLVDMTKAEALGAMGEDRAALELAERHLQSTSDLG